MDAVGGDGEGEVLSLRREGKGKEGRRGKGTWREVCISGPAESSRVNDSRFQSRDDVVVV